MVWMDFHRLGLGTMGFSLFQLILRGFIGTLCWRRLGDLVIDRARRGDFRGLPSESNSDSDPSLLSNSSDSKASSNEAADSRLRWIVLAALASVFLEVGSEWIVFGRHLPVPT